MKEKERKFLLKYLPSDIHDITPERIEQGYLMLQDGKQLRIRIVNEQDAWLCYKAAINPVERDEFEYLVPIQDGVAMMESTEIKLTKIRHKLRWEGYLIDIDVYNRHGGLMVVEIEGDGVENLTKFPEYFGREITGNSLYSNIELAKR